MKTTDLYDYKGVAVVIYLHSYTIIHIHMVKLCAEDARAVGDGPGGEGVGRGGSEEALLEGGGTVAEALLEGRVHRRSGVVLDAEIAGPCTTCTGRLLSSIIFKVFNIIGA